MKFVWIILGGLVAVAIVGAMAGSSSPAPRVGSAVPSPRDPDQGDLRDKACPAAEKFVRARLKAPSTAKFQPCDSRIAWQDGSQWTMSGWVDAQNSYGAMLRSSWNVIMDREEGQFRLVAATVE